MRSTKPVGTGHGLIQAGCWPGPTQVRAGAVGLPAASSFSLQLPAGGDEEQSARDQDDADDHGERRQSEILPRQDHDARDEVEGRGADGAISDSCPGAAGSCFIPAG
jgi:hypothetical protein